MTTPSKPFERCYWVVSGKLLAGCYPGDQHEAKARAKISDLLDAGVRTFINLMEAHETNWQGKPFAPYEDLVRELAAERGIETTCVRLPIRDQDVPSVPRMNEIQAALEQATSDGGAAYVHCWGGKGRTGTVVGCYLIRHGLATAGDFKDVIDRLRGPDRATGPSPENPKQVAFVREYCGKSRGAASE